jgi:tetratricopeptide (TPR) repeat protein
MSSKVGLKTGLKIIKTYFQSPSTAGFMDVLNVRLISTIGISIARNCDVPEWPLPGSIKFFVLYHAGKQILLFLTPMSMSRLEQLLRFVEEDPGDPFNIYAVAIEYLKLDASKAIPFFSALLKDHPGYVPTYYTYGKLLQQTKEYGEAKKIFETGIEKARAKNDLKAVGELRNALSELAFDME